MLKQKRPFPPVMAKAEERIEQWRSSLLGSIHPRLDVAIYLLVLSTCGHIGSETKRRMPREAPLLMSFIRHKLFGLQFALSGIDGDLPESRFIEKLVADSINREEAIKANEAVEQMSAYASARDTFLTYGWGGYELDESAENFLRFVDNPAWVGRRDRAQQVIAEEIEMERAQSLTPQLDVPPQWIVERAVDLPQSLSLGNLTASQFISAWTSLGWSFRRHWMDGLSPVLEKESLVAQVQRVANLAFHEAERFVNLVTFDRIGSRVLTLFHCPIIPLTTTSMIVVPPGLIFGNPRACIPRLAVFRGPRIDAFSRELEAYILEKLRSHYGADGVTINLRVPYSGKDDSGDLDLLVYESSRNRLLVAEVKAFIVPDTVDEVVRANHALDDGLNQVEKAKRFLNNLSFPKWEHALRMPFQATPPEVKFAVIGNSFAGSDYLAIPQDVSVVDGDYLMLPRFAGKSIFDAIADYQVRLSEEGSRALEGLSFNAIEVGGITIEVPSWIIGF